MHKYEVPDEKQDILNEVKNRWNNCKVKDAIHDPEIWFNELYNLNLKFKKIKKKYEKMKMKCRHTFLVSYLKNIKL